MILILEIFFSLLTTPLILIIIFPFMLLKYIRNKYVLSSYMGGLFGLISFSFTPNLKGQTDLERYLVEIQNLFGNSSFSQVVKVSLTKDEFLVDILMYLSGRLGNPRFFPMILMAVFYFVSTYIILDLGIKYGASSKRILYTLCVYLTLVPYAYVGETLRNATGVLIVFLGLYLYFCKKKNIIIVPLFFILGMGIHVSSLSLIPLFIITFFYKRYNRTGILALIFFSTSSPIIITFLSKIIGNINPVFTAFFEKGIRYLSAKNGDYINYLQNSIFMQIQKLYFIGIVIFFFLITFYITRKKYKGFSKFDLNILTFFELISSFIIGLSFIKTDIYIRFTMLWLLLLSFYFYKIEKLLLEKLQPTEKKIYNLLVGIILAGGALHQIVYFEMMVNLVETFEKFVFFPLFL